MYKEININNFLYKTLIITNFNSKSIRFFFKSVKNKEGRVSSSHPPCDRQIDILNGSG